MTDTGKELLDKNFYVEANNYFVKKYINYLDGQWRVTKKNLPASLDDDVSLVVGLLNSYEATPMDLKDNYQGSNKDFFKAYLTILRDAEGDWYVIADKQRPEIHYVYGGHDYIMQNLREGGFNTVEANKILSNATVNENVKGFEKGGKSYENGGKTHVAETIIEQLGGMRRLKMFTGAFNFIAYPNGVSYKLPDEYGGANYVKITLNSMDTYDIEAGRITRNEVGMPIYKKLYDKSGLYDDQLVEIIERETKMYLHFAKGGKTNKILETGGIVKSFDDWIEGLDDEDLEDFGIWDLTEDGDLDREQFIEKHRDDLKAEYNDILGSEYRESERFAKGGKTKNTMKSKNAIESARLAGYEVTTTGGGLEALRKELDGNRYLLVTHNGDIPMRMNDNVLIGMYDGDEHLHAQAEATLKELLEDEEKYILEASDVYAGGGKLSRLWKKTKELSGTAAKAAKEGYASAKEATKKKIHDTKKDIAWHVLQDTRSIVESKKDSIILNEASNLIDENYAKGGSIKVKAICTHCGKKQTAAEKDYSLNYVACKFCKKRGDLREIKEKGGSAKSEFNDLVDKKLQYQLKRQEARTQLELATTDTDQKKAQEKIRYYDLMIEELSFEEDEMDNDSDDTDSFAKGGKTNEGHQARPYWEWEGEIYDIVEQKLDVTRSDAQGIVDAQGWVLNQSWGKGLSAQETANKIINAGTQSLGSGGRTPRITARPKRRRAEKGSRINDWGGEPGELFFDLDEGELEMLKDEGTVETGHWVLYQAGDGEWEATRDGLYMEVFSSMQDMLERVNQKEFYEYSSQLSDENGHETFVDENGAERAYAKGGRTKSSYNRGRSWHMDRERRSKEPWEKNRKPKMVRTIFEEETFGSFASGGKITKEHWKEFYDLSKMGLDESPISLAEYEKKYGDYPFAAPHISPLIKKSSSFEDFYRRNEAGRYEAGGSVKSTFAFHLNRVLTDKELAYLSSRFNSVDESAYGENVAEENIVEVTTFKPMSKESAIAVFADAMRNRGEYDRTVLRVFADGGAVASGDVAESGVSAYFNSLNVMALPMRARKIVEDVLVNPHLMVADENNETFIRIKGIIEKHLPGALIKIKAPRAPSKPPKAPSKPPKAPAKSNDIGDAIAALEILADSGIDGASDAIDALKLLEEMSGEKARGGQAHYNTGRSWHLDRARKSQEPWEMADGGTVVPDIPWFEKYKFEKGGVSDSSQPIFVKVRVVMDHNNKRYKEPEETDINVRHITGITKTDEKVPMLDDGTIYRLNVVDYNVYLFIGQADYDKIISHVSGFADGGKTDQYNRGRSWHMDRAMKSSEPWETK